MSFGAYVLSNDVKVILTSFCCPARKHLPRAFSCHSIVWSITTNVIAVPSSLYRNQQGNYRCLNVLMSFCWLTGLHHKTLSPTLRLCRVFWRTKPSNDVIAVPESLCRSVNWRVNTKQPLYSCTDIVMSLCSHRDNTQQ